MQDTSREPSDKKSHVLAPEEAKKLLGRVFYRSPFTRHSCLLGPDAYRIIGWTKSRKRVIVEKVPQDDEKNADQTWLKEHPIAAPLVKGGIQARYEPATASREESLRMERDFFTSQNWVANLKKREMR